MSPTELQWQCLASKTAVRLRWGAILRASNPVVLLVGFGLLGLGITGRLNGWQWSGPLTIIAAAVFVFILSVVLVVALKSARGSLPTGFARLDHTMGLHSALSSAAAGRGPWPVVPVNSDDLLRFKWNRILPSWIVSVLLTAAGLLIPLPAGAIAAGKIPPPRSHEEIAALISELNKVEPLSKEDLKRLQEQLDEIRNQPAENWYRHSSLEAADHLQAGLEEQLRALENGLNKAASSLASLEATDESLSSAEKQRLAGEFKAALKGLKTASPGLNQKLVEALSGIDPANMKSLTDGEVGKMLEQMKAAAAACKECRGQGKGGRNGMNGDAQSELDKSLESGENPGAGQSQSEGPGRGGIQRGPGVAALPLSQSSTDLATNKPESLGTEDFSHAHSGDAIGTAEAGHKLDKSPLGSMSGGSATTGQGGEAVSRDRLVPSEKAILRSYFR